MLFCANMTVTNPFGGILVGSYKYQNGLVHFLRTIYESVYFCSYYSASFMENDLVILINKSINIFKTNLIKVHISKKKNVLLFPDTATQSIKLLPQILLSKYTSEILIKRILRKFKNEFISR